MFNLETVQSSAFLEQVVSLPQCDYEEFLSNLMTRFIRPGYDRFILNLRDKNRISLIRFIVLLNGKLKATGRVLPLVKLSNEVHNASGGFLLSNGKDVIDCTPEYLQKENPQALVEALSFLN